MPIQMWTGFVIRSKFLSLRTFPEVERVFGKIGRADTATDPAPLSMIQMTIKLKPEDQRCPEMTPKKLIAEMNDASVQKRIGQLGQESHRFSGPPG